jgi:hypothetical protein
VNAREKSQPALEPPMYVSETPSVGLEWWLRTGRGGVFTRAVVGAANGLVAAA